jgi:hypothetical protein
MKNKIRILGSCPEANPAERGQIIRVTNEIAIAAAKEDDWAIIVRDVDYSHHAGKRIEFDRDWNGQFDILVFTQSKIVIYELKAFTVNIIYGNTGPQNWYIRRLNASGPNRVPSYFLQVSKQRAYLLRDYLESLRLSNTFTDEQHFVVDARLVFKSGSNLSGFFHSPTRTIHDESFELDFLNNITAVSDKEFMENAYSHREKETGKRLLRRLPKEDYARLNDIYLTYGFVDRTTKWFKMLTEEMIIKDYGTCGSDRFSISFADAIEICRGLGIDANEMESM